MNLFILLILLLVKSVKLDGCHEYVDKENNQVDFVKECNNGSKPCVIKCCGPNEALYAEIPLLYCTGKDKIAALVNLTNEKQADLKSYSGLTIASDNGNSTKTLLSDFRVLYRRYSYNTTRCSASAGVPTNQKHANIKEDGRLASIEYGVVEASEYCFDVAVSSEAMVAYIFHMAYDDNTEVKQRILFTVYCAPISALFLLLTLVVYGMVKRLHCNLIGIMTMVFMTSLMCVVIMTAYRNGRDIVTEFNQTDCTWLSPIIYFLTLSTFFWMNVMCFEIWRTIRSSKARIPHCQRFADLVTSKKLVYYALYAWGTPAILTTIAVAIDKNESESIIKPGFDTCFRNAESKGLVVPRMYQYVPMMVLVAANIVLFLMTIYNIRMIKQGFSGFSADKKQNKKNENLVLLYLKLFVIMGVSWIIEVIQELSPTSLTPSWFYLVNGINALIGVLIFATLVIKKDILVKLCQRLGIENRWTRRGTHMKTTRTDLSKTRSKAVGDSIQFDSISMNAADQHDHSNNMKR